MAAAAACPGACGVTNTLHSLLAFTSLPLLPALPPCTAPCTALQYCYFPIPLIIQAPRKVDPFGELWNRLRASIGQPNFE
jgi:hypothetical protein